MDLHRIRSLWRYAVRRLLGADSDRPDGRCRLGPEWLALVVNNFCNLRCKMCDVGIGESETVFYAHLVGDDPPNMSLNLLETILDQAASFFPKPKIGLAFTEPLIHVHILKFCQAIIARGFFSRITTNRFLLPRLAEALVDLGVHSITVSVDGPEEVHDRVRGRTGSFRNLYEGVERLNRAKMHTGRRQPAVSFSYTLTDENYIHMRDFVRQVEGLQPTSFNFSHLNFISAEMATAHNASYGGELAVVRSNLGTMNLAAIDLAAMWQAIQGAQSLCRLQS